MLDFESLPQIITSLNYHKVEYMIVGGFAVSYYGYVRVSMARNTNRPTDKADLDIWYNPTYENYFNLLNALEAVQLDVERLKAEQDPNPKKSFLKFDLADCTLDLNPAIRAPIRFRDAYNRRTAFKRNSMEISFIGLEDLINDKELMGRPKDIIDILELRKLYPSI
jgi:hypothetical protein